MSLVEVLIVVGILGTTAVLMSSMMTYNANQSALMNAKSDSLQLKNEIEQAIRNPVGCKSNMSASAVVVPTNYSMTNLKYYDTAGTARGDVVPALNAALNNNPRLKVTSMTLTGPGAAGAPTNIGTFGTSTNYAANLVVNIGYMAGATGAPIKPLIIEGLTMTVDGTGAVIGCKVGQAVACATAVRTVQKDATNTAYAVDTGVISDSDVGWTATYPQAFNSISTGGAGWGVACNSGYSMTGCRGSNLRQSTTSTDATIIQGTNSCTTPDNSVANNPIQSSLYVTCCISK